LMTPLHSWIPAIGAFFGTAVAAVQ